MNDKTAETLLEVAAIAALVALVVVAPEYNHIIIPAILAVVAALTAYEGGRRRGKRKG